MSERDDLVARLRGWDRCWPAPWLEGAVQDAVDQIERDGREIDRLLEQNDRLGRVMACAEEPSMERAVDAAFAALPQDAYGTIGAGEMYRVLVAALRVLTQPEEPQP